MTWFLTCLQSTSYLPQMLLLDLFLSQSLLSYSRFFSPSTWSCLLFHKNGFSLLTYLLFSHSLKCISVIIMISLPSCLRERNVRPDTSTRTLDPSFLTFSRTLTHKFLLVIFSFSTNSFPLVCVFTHLIHTQYKNIHVCLLGADWMNQQIFFKPWMLSNFFLLLLSHYSCTWESSLHWLCQFTQFSFISQPLLSWLFITCFWISSPSYYVKYAYLLPFSLDSTWFPVAFDSADREYLSGFYNIILPWIFSLSPTFSIFSLTLYITPFLYILIFLSHTYLPLFFFSIYFFFKVKTF